MSRSINKKYRIFHMGMASKLTVAVCSIIVLLLVSETISIVEFSSMSTYVSDQISDDIENINLSTELGVSLDEYNLQILSVVGKADSINRSTLDPKPYLNFADSVLLRLSEKEIDCCDSLKAVYDTYVRTSLQLDSVVVSDFVDTRDWYFTSLQPTYNLFRMWMDAVNREIYGDLQYNSASFDESFYRSIIPGVVSVMAGILLCCLLLFFILVYYVHPLKKILSGLDAYKRNSQPYRNVFEGNDELQELNGSISDLVDENITLKKRIRERER